MSHSNILLAHALNQLDDAYQFYIGNVQAHMRSASPTDQKLYERNRAGMRSAIKILAQHFGSPEGDLIRAHDVLKETDPRYQQFRDLILELSLQIIDASSNATTGDCTNMLHVAVAEYNELIVGYEQEERGDQFLAAIKKVVRAEGNFFRRLDEAFRDMQMPATVQNVSDYIHEQWGVSRGPAMVLTKIYDYSLKCR